MVELYNFYKNKKVFVTGHTGFKGSWLSIWLSMMGAKVVGYALPTPTNPSMFEIANVSAGITSLTGDIRDREKLTEALNDANPDILFHMAAQPLVRDSYVNPAETYEINVLGTVYLFDIVRSMKKDMVVVNITTDKVYENREWYWGYRENEPFGGYDPYSNSKACSELVSSSFRNSFFNISDYGIKHKIALATVRAGNVIGGGDWAVDRLIPDIVRSITEQKTVRIRNPYAIRPWQHVLEPLSGYLVLAKQLFEGNIQYADGWNFGPDDSDAREVEWIVSRICELWPGAKYEIDKGKHPHEANYLKLDCSKAKKELGWHPRWNLDVALIKIIEWTRAFLENADMRAVTEKQITSYINL
jgi:CDP-glucose 4,6-dehydratase